MVALALSKSLRLHMTCSILSKLCPCLRLRSGLYRTECLTTWCISYLFFSYSLISFCLQEAMVTGIDDWDCHLTYHESRLMATLYNTSQWVSPNNWNDEWWSWFTPPSNSSELYDLVCFYLFLCKIDSLLCFSLFRIIFCPHGTQQTLCHCLSSCTILMHPHHRLWLSFLQVLLVRTSCLLTLVHLPPAFREHCQFRTKHLSLTNPSATVCPALTKSPRSKSSNQPESFPTWFLWGQCVFLTPLSRFLTYYFSFSLVNVIIC